jgi:hypothetical protein
MTIFVNVQPQDYLPIQLYLLLLGQQQAFTQHFKHAAQGSGFNHSVNQLFIASLLVQGPNQNQH